MLSTHNATEAKPHYPTAFVLFSLLLACAFILSGCTLRSNPENGKTYTSGTAVIDHVTYGFHPEGYASVDSMPETPYGDIIIPESIEYYNETYTLKAITKYAFKNNTYCTDLTVPGTVTTIGESCFEGSALQSLSLPESLETIGDRAFANCTGLTQLTIPSSVAKIGREAFDSTIVLIVLNGSYAQSYAQDNGISTIVLDSQS